MTRYPYHNIPNTTVNIIEDSWSGKTYMFKVYNSKNNKLLGIIKWYYPYRKYTFIPETNTPLSTYIMDIISRFIKSLMREHNNLRIKRLKEERNYG